MASMPVPELAASSAPAISPSSSSTIRAPASRTCSIRSWWRGRSRMAMARSETRASRAKAIRRRLSASGSSRSSAPRASGPATIFSTYQTAGMLGNPSGSTATSTECAPVRPLATRLAPSTGYTAKSNCGWLPGPISVPCESTRSPRGPSTTRPPKPSSSNACSMAVAAAERARSDSPRPMCLALSLPKGLALRGGRAAGGCRVHRRSTCGCACR